MSRLSFTLLSEGTSDRALLPLLGWTIRSASPEEIEVAAQWADLARLPNPPKTLAERIRAALDLYPCQLLFVHRDPDRTSRQKRVREIQQALKGFADPPVVCVVPVRSLEAWFLFDEEAIRRAAGNPSGREPLELPAAEAVEKIADPKRQLKETLLRASKAGKRRRKSPHAAVHRISELIQDFSPLRRLPAFNAFQEELRAALRKLQP